ncbi:MAG: ComF family protein [Rhizobiaceae bacterium]|nr:ComF family protein [Rhizobiaceae bacterium]
MSYGRRGGYSSGWQVAGVTAGFLSGVQRLGAAPSSGLARLLFPPICVGCRSIVAEPGTLCPACWPRLRFLEAPWCAVLGTPFAHEMGEGAVSPAAMADPPPFARARSAVAFGGVARDIVHNLKYRDRTDLAPWMAKWMARAGAELLADADLVVPVPLHRRRFFARRFNQSAELARHMSAQRGLVFAPEIVERVKRTRQQVGLERRAREDNMRGAFAVPKPMRERVKGSKVLVVDDVYTTGATVKAVASVLARAGAARVDVLTFARALRDFLPEEETPIYEGNDREEP